MRFLIILCSLFLLPITGSAQAQTESINNINANGQRQGEWRIPYERVCWHLNYNEGLLDGVSYCTNQSDRATVMMAVFNMGEPESLTVYDTYGHVSYIYDSFKEGKDSFYNMEGRCRAYHINGNLRLIGKIVFSKSSMQLDKQISVQGEFEFYNIFFGSGDAALYDINGSFLKYENLW